MYVFIMYTPLLGEEQGFTSNHGDTMKGYVEYLQSPYPNQWDRQGEYPLD